MNKHLPTNFCFTKNPSSGPCYKSLIGWAILLVFALVQTASGQSAETMAAAQAEMAQGDWKAAQVRLEAEAPATLSPHGAFLLGRCYQALMQHDQAVKLFMQADTTQIRVLAEWGESLERLGREQEAERIFLAAYQQDSTYIPVATSLARLLSENNRWPEVTAIYQRLLQENPVNSHLYAQLGTAYARMDSAEQAIIHYERAQALNPSDVRVALALSKVYYDHEALSSARHAITTALEVQPRHPRLWRRKGEIELRDENYPKAVEAYSHAVTWGDSLAIDLRGLGVGHFMTDAFGPAATMLQKAYDQDSTDVMGAFYLGLTMQQLDHRDKAYYYLYRAADLLGQTTLADIHSRIASIHDQEKDYGEAIRIYRLALSLDTTRTDIHFHLAALYDAYFADKKTVLEQYERFLERVQVHQMPEMQRYAHQRAQELRERLFFETPKTTPGDTLK